MELLRTIKKKFFFQIFRIWGWKVVGLKPNFRKYMIVVAPHTSNTDFFVGYTAKHLVDFDPNFLAKKSLFDLPLIGWGLRIMGGYPVDRSKKTNLVDQIVEIFDKTKDFILVVTPEATRSLNPNWKTGFYHIALRANVPIVNIAFDYSSKTVVVDKPSFPSGNIEEEIGKMKDFFRQFKGKYPEKGVL